MPRSEEAPGQAADLDQVDLALIGLLLEDARLSQRQLGQRVGMSAPAVGARLARLERLGIVTGYRAEIDWPRLGFPLVAYIGAVTGQHGEQPAVIAALRAMPEVEQVDMLTGPLDLMIRVRVRDHDHLRSCLIDGVWRIPGIQRTETFVVLTPQHSHVFGPALLSPPDPADPG
jgi:Lrp/AsnC family leucine-responsive transcriptional regulator